MKLPARIVRKIAGPPGTGKSTTLLNYVDTLFKNRVAPEEVIFTTFTRAGAYEARDRAVQRFNLPPERLCYFRTLHSLCYQEIGGEVMQPADWFQLARSLGLYFTFKTATEEGVPRGSSRGDYLMSLWSLSRVLMKPLDEVFERRDEWFIHSPDLSLAELQHFAMTVRNYKLTFGKIDYTDILQNFVDSERELNCDYVIVDEAQDLSPLQWKVVEKLSRHAKETVVAGDDDQCIHEWNGADPRLFINLQADHYQVLPQSYRIPFSVHRLSQDVIRRVPERLDKTYEPRKEEGRVVYVSDLSQLDLGQGSWLMLARNHCFLDQFEELCKHRGLLFTRAGHDGGELEEARRAVIAWKTLLAGVPVPVAQVKPLYKLMSQRDRVKRGCKTILYALDDTKLVTLEELRREHGLLTDLPWPKALDLMHDDTRAYLQAIEKRQGLEEPARIRLSTIHGAKGTEADNVVIAFDMTQKSWDAYRKAPSAEHRVWYVGLTRARESLFILQPNNDLHYSHTT